MGFFEDNDSIVRSPRLAISSATAITQFDFNTGGITGKDGPTQVDLDTSYNGTTLDGIVTLNVALQELVLNPGYMYITLKGAEGGFGVPGLLPGRGALVTCEIELTEQSLISVLCGSMGSTPTITNTYLGGGGGGMSFVKVNNVYRAIAGGGGGSSNYNIYSTVNSNSCHGHHTDTGQHGYYGSWGAGAAMPNGGGAGQYSGGGAGSLTQGADSTGKGGLSTPTFVGGLGSNNANGGFGGGGGAYAGAAGGGGAGGGGAGAYTSGFGGNGGGGGSWTDGLNQFITNGLGALETGNGYVTIIYEPIGGGGGGILLSSRIITKLL